jgi:hypothetical protein
MSTHVLSASALIQAPPEIVYGIIADYHDGHTRIIPRPPFVSLEVEEGGVGSGTRIRVGIRALGMVQHFRAVISEPEPGRVLVEANDTGYVTTFIVDPRDGGQAAEVTIRTELPPRPPLVGALERWWMGRTLPGTFAQELRLLGEVARSWPAVAR